MKNRWIPLNRDGTTVKSMCATTLALCLVPLVWGFARDWFQRIVSGEYIFALIYNCLALDELGGFPVFVLKAARLSVLAAAVLACIFEQRKFIRVLTAFWTPFALTGAFALCAAFGNEAAGYFFTIVMALALLYAWMKDSSANRRSPLSALLMALPLAGSALCIAVLKMKPGDLIPFFYATYLLSLYGSFWAFQVIMRLGQIPGCGLVSFILDLPGGSSISAPSNLDRVLLIGAALFSAVVCFLVFAVFIWLLWPYLTTVASSFRLP